MRHGFTIRTTALVVSIALHAVWFVQVGGSVGAQDKLDKPTHSTATRLVFAAPKSIAPPEPEIKPRPKPNPPAQKPKPARKVQKPEKPKPVFKPVPEPLPLVEEKPMPAAPAKPVQLVSTLAMPAVAPTVDEGVIRLEQQRYLVEVMTHVEKHKRYPKVARRRGIEGAVKISFLLMDDGSIRHVDVEGTSKVLRLAAAQAVAKAGDMPPPPAEVHCPLSCEFSMRFALN